MTLDPLPTREAMTRSLLAVLAKENRPLPSSFIADAVAVDLGLHNWERPSRSISDRRTDFEYQLAWIRSHLKRQEFVFLRSDKLWEITRQGLEHFNINPDTMKS